MKQWQEEIFKVYVEAKQFEAGKYHPRFGKTAQELRTKGFSVPSRDAMIFISNLLEDVGIFSEDETDSVVKNFNAAERRLRFLELLDIHSEEIKSKSSDIEELYSAQIERYSKVEAANRGSKGRQEKYEANAAARELMLQQRAEIRALKADSTGSATDALNVLSAGLDEAEQEMSVSLKGTFEDDTTIFEIALENPGFVDKVVNFLKPFAGESEIEVYDNRIEFSADPGSDIAKLVNKIGVDKVEDTINDWLDSNTTGGVVSIITPDSPESAAAYMDAISGSSKRDSRMLDDDPEEAEPEEFSDLPEMPIMYDDEDMRGYSSRRPYSDDDDEYGGESFSRRRLGYGDEDEEHEGARRSPEEGEYDQEAFNDGADLSEYEKKRSRAIERSKRGEENNEEHKMSPQQINQWMYMQRASRMQNNLRQNERWGNY